MRIDTPAFSCGPFARKMLLHPLTLSLNASLGSKWVSCRQQMDGSCLFIQSATLWHFMGVFKPWKLRLHTERYDFNDAMYSVKSLYRLWLSALHHSCGTIVRFPLLLFLMFPYSRRVMRVLRRSLYGVDSGGRVLCLSFLCRQQFWQDFPREQTFRWKRVFAEMSFSVLCSSGSTHGTKAPWILFHLP